MIPTTFYGLRIFPTDGSPSTFEWISCYQGRAEDRAERLSRHAPSFTYTVEETPVLFWEYGWYVTDQAGVFARVYYRDSKIVKGALYRLKGDRTHYLDISILWYLQGSSVKPGFPNLLRKAEYEDHHGVIRDLRQLAG